MSGTSVLHNTLWRQGSVIPRELLPSSLLPEDLDPVAKLVLLSHSCDVVHTSYEAEPYAEFLIAHRVAAIDGSKTKGKNPRRLQLPISINGEETFHEISIHDKARMDRKLLENGSPDPHCLISPGNIRLLGTWAGKRYHRHAFPDAFNRRTSGATKRLKRSLERNGHAVLGVFLYLDTDRELPETDDYRIMVWVVAERSATENDEEEQKLLSLVAEISAALGTCSGIDSEVALVSETEFTFEEVRNSSRWDFDYLSDVESEHFCTPAE